MATFAKIDGDGVVTDITLVDDDVENQAEFLSELLGGEWIETVTDDPDIAPASMGGYYIASRNVFTASQPFESWTLNEETLEWEPPVPMPADIGAWDWNEASGSWENLNDQ